MTAADPILVTGGTGTTGRALAAILRGQGAAVRTASRQPTVDSHPGEHVRLDWSDPATFPAALAGVERIYLLPPVRLPMTMLEPFLAIAQVAGVRRIVLLSVSTTTSTSAPIVDRMHREVARTASQWAILRPTWFMQNFLRPGPLATGICERGEIATATGAGRIGFIDAEDVAAVAARMLLDDDAPNSELRLTGPEALNYGDVAAIISEVSNRPVRHRHLTAAERLDGALAAGVPAEIAHAMVEMDTMIKNGVEDKVTSVVENLTGRPPRSFRDFATNHRTTWRSDLDPVER
jgi:uncharacterized protein YbjT (DUF2867 family)